MLRIPNTNMSQKRPRTVSILRKQTRNRHKSGGPAGSTKTGKRASFSDEPQVNRECKRFTFWQMARPHQISALSLANQERSALTMSILNENAISQRPDWCRPSDRARVNIERLVNSCTWNIFVLVFTFILLFGSPFQLAVNSSEITYYFDATFIVTTLYLTIDIILTAFVCAAYFPLHWKSWREFKCGSFLFWFDVISVSTMFYSISFFHATFCEADVLLFVNEGISDEKIRHAVEPNGILLWTVCFRSLKVARFFNITSVVDFTNTCFIMATSCMNRLGCTISTASTASSQRRRAWHSEIGMAMNYITAKRCGIGGTLTFLVCFLFTNQERDTTEQVKMIALHRNLIRWNDTYPEEQNFTIAAEMFTHVAFPPESGQLISLRFADGLNNNLTLSCTFDDRCKEVTEDDHDIDHESGRHQDRVIKVCENNSSRCTSGKFATGDKDLRLGLGTLGQMFFVIMTWYIGLLLISEPVTTLVAVPIERMIRLLGMMVDDTLAYESSDEYKMFLSEEDDLATYTCFSKDNLKGMETDFLMNSILRIGSLMKVGFGAAGVQIVHDSMRRQRKAYSTVSCIFLFCDIRQFTDTSECLQEEIFLFTNKIAEVVHSNCHAFGGFANQNKGDAFLVIWKLEDGPDELNAINKEADRALLAVVHICMALNYEEFFLSIISDEGRQNLKNKFKDRKGNMIQIGFGLNAGKAVEGAIGTPRKLDATYLSNEVELAEFLESSTKKYGVNVLMSGKFYHLLDPSNQRHCRQLDEAFFPEENDDDIDEDLINVHRDEGETFMRIYTYDFDFEILRTWNGDQNEDTLSDMQSNFSEISFRHGAVDQKLEKSRRSIFKVSAGKKRKTSMKRLSILGIRQDALRTSSLPDIKSSARNLRTHLTLPSGPVHYHSSLWKEASIKKMRCKFNQLFFKQFQVGLDAYLDGNWIEARKNLTSMVIRYDDKPSKVLLKKMETHNYRPRNKFRFYLGKIE